MPAAYMYLYKPPQNNDYKPTYEDFLAVKETGVAKRLNDVYSSSGGYETTSDGSILPVVRFAQTFTGPNARFFLTYKPEFVFVDYRDIVSYYRLSMPPQKGKTLVEVVFKELVYDIKPNRIN